MKAENYFKKNGFIFGDSYNERGHNIYFFRDWEEAQEWLHTEEYDFRTRELITKTEAKKCGFLI